MLANFESVKQRTAINVIQCVSCLAESECHPVFIKRCAPFNYYHSIVVHTLSFSISLTISQRQRSIVECHVSLVDGVGHHRH